MLCESIVSEESRAGRDEDELDYEEETRPEDNPDKDEGELDDDEDLEEGEVKEDSEEEDQAARRPAEPQDAGQAPTGARQNSVCRFYGRGQCTWGNNCRFVHPTGALPQKRGPPPPLPPPRRPPRDYESESAWERGLKQAKEMLERAHRRKEEDNEFEDKRFHLAAEAREASPEGRLESDEYERRRRLAFESAPWNQSEDSTKLRQNSETFRDPWRRSKSPKRGQKRSHSMSSISGSGSDSTDFSGSEASDSFSSSSNGSRRSGRPRPNRKTMSEKKTEEPRKKPVATHAQKEYDSWSESLSESESDVSSFYSDDSQSEERRAKRPKEPIRAAKRPKSPPKEELPKKTPIKMTFLKKSVKKECLANKLNGGRQEAPEEDESKEASPVSSPVSPGEKSLQATVSRREELLQQLKAVEDAIRRKKEKIN